MKNGEVINYTKDNKNLKFTKSKRAGLKLHKKGKLNSEKLLKMNGIKFDGEKPDWSLIDLEIIQQMASVLTYGAKKYSRHNYDKVEPYRYLGALMRHITAWQQGEIFDKETGMHHLVHAMTNLHILIRLEKKNINYNKDD